MFKLSAQELDSAFAALQHHGYSAMLPPPPEWDVVAANWNAVRAAIETIDLETYSPFEPMVAFAPKSRSNIRVLHIMHPQDIVIYTALVLIAKNDIELNRVPKSAKRVFSYRADIARPGELYDSRGAYEAYQARLAVKAAKAKVKFVAVADIADFYPRIYQHRLENVIESIATTQRVRDVARVLVQKLIGNVMGKNSYGIPVGPYASRLLAEAVLIDVDASLLTKGIDFIRWVDDYSFFCDTEYEAQSVLFELGEWLFAKHGLTLQSAKTTILTAEEYRSRRLINREGNLTDRDSVVGMLRAFDIGYAELDDDEAEEELDEGEVQAALALLQGTDLKGMLEASLQDTTLVDYEAVTYALTRLPRIPGAPAALKRDVLHLVIDNARLLYPVAEHIATYVLSFEDLSKREQSQIANKLLKPLKSQRNPPPPYYAMWVLHIFASSADWNHAQDIVKLYVGSNSAVVKRHAALAISASGTRSEALLVKDEYSAAAPLLKLAILFASKKLGKDERKHWRLAQGVSGAIEKLI